jgi:predicted nucleic acid-binding protein
MKTRVLDTNILIEIWHGRWPGGKPVRSEEAAAEEAKKWLKKYPGDGILTPIQLEFIGGTRNKDELRLTDLVLAQFELLDGGEVLPEDWAEAARIARRIKGKGRARDAIDCLIRAVCKRINADLLTRDTGM